MYEHAKGNYVCRGDKNCGSPVREIKTVTDKEAKYWDSIERQIRAQKVKK